MQYFATQRKSGYNAVKIFLEKHTCPDELVSVRPKDEMCVRLVDVACACLDDIKSVTSCDVVSVHSVAEKMMSKIVDGKAGVVTAAFIPSFV